MAVTRSQTRASVSPLPLRVHAASNAAPGPAARAQSSPAEGVDACATSPIPTARAQPSSAKGVDAFALPSTPTLPPAPLQGLNRALRHALTRAQRPRYPPQGLNRALRRASTRSHCPRPQRCPRPRCESSIEPCRRRRRVRNVPDTHRKGSTELCEGRRRVRIALDPNAAPGPAARAQPSSAACVDARTTSPIPTARAQPSSSEGIDYRTPPHAHRRPTQGAAATGDHSAASCGLPSAHRPLMNGDPPASCPEDDEDEDVPQPSEDLQTFVLEYDVHKDLQGAYEAYESRDDGVEEDCEGLPIACVDITEGASPPIVSQQDSSVQSQSACLPPAPSARKARSKKRGCTPKKKEAARLAKQNRVKKKKALKRAAMIFNPSVKVRVSWSEKHGAPQVMETSFTAADLDTAKGAWVGIRTPKKSAVTVLKEGLKDGLKVVTWDGEHPVALVDKGRRVIAVLAGRPVKCSGWERCWKQAEQAMCEVEGVQATTATSTRRGDFPCLATGVSHGGGQKAPGNLKHNAREARLVDRLTQNSKFRRMAGFANAACAMYAPKLHQYYKDTFEALYRRHPGLAPAFPNTIWPAASFNLGDRVVTREHRDAGNLPQGWCALFSLGTFDPTKGGHLILRELGFMVEFPPGSLILLPSSTITHGNTPIRKGESRKSFALYAAEGLFRWVNYGFRGWKAFVEEDPLGAAKVKGDGPARWKEAVDMYSVVDELHADRVKCGLVRGVKKYPLPV